jgi:peptidoglycan/LPS O-acetylase OafA/YrhL
VNIRSLISVTIPEKMDLALMLRAYAAIGVIYWHVHGYHASSNMEKMFTMSGRFCVWTFFVLSGFLMGLSILSRYSYETHGINGVFIFYKNRLLRILPIFFFVQFIVLMFKCYIVNPPMDINLLNPLKELGMLQWNQNYELNGVFWTIGIEMQFYLIAPLLIYLFARKSLVKTTLFLGLTIFLLLVSKQLMDGNDLMRLDVRNLYGNLVHFLMGMMIAFLYPFIASKAKFMGTKHVVVVCCSAMIVLFTANALFFRNIAQFLNWRGILLTDMFTILILILHIRFEIKRTMARKYLYPLLYLGTLSYGIYAWHGAVSALSMWCREIFIINFLASTMLAWLTYIFIEKPLMRFKSQSISKSYHVQESHRTVEFVR